MKYLIQYKSFPFICQRDWEPHDCISRRITITPRTTTLLFKEQVSFPRNSRRSRRISDDSYYPIGHVRYINIPTWLRGFRAKIVNFFKFILSPNSQKRLGYKENTTKYRSLSWKPRSHVRILIYRTWPIAYKPEHSEELWLDGLRGGLVKVFDNFLQGVAGYNLCCWSAWDKRTKFGNCYVLANFSSWVGPLKFQLPLP